MKKISKVLLCICALSVGGAGVAYAGPLSDAMEAHERKDYATALRLYRSLADQGNEFSQIMLGRMYDIGQGVPQDYAEAVKWYRKAADQGSAGVSYLLGYSYHFGHGVPQDYAEAVKWYLKAVDQGDEYAQNNLGTMYRDGLGVPKDYVQAHKWFNLAASHGSHISTMNREEIAAKMTPAQIAEAQKLAREWKPAKP